MKQQLTFRVVVLDNNDAAATLLGISNDGILVDGLYGEEVHQTHIDTLTLKLVGCCHGFTQGNGSTNNQYLVVS